jgi:hypothetical protein
MVAQAECGWLMVPPRFGHTPLADASEPMELWSQYSAYDSAAACERVRAAVMEEVDKARTSVGDHKILLRNQMAGGRCLPASQVPVR